MSKDVEITVKIATKEHLKSGSEAMLHMDG